MFMIFLRNFLCVNINNGREISNDNFGIGIVGRIIVYISSLLENL